jgi:ubiquinone/menaquinone biosynthesis C-methylase UbiE
MEKTFLENSKVHDQIASRYGKEHPEIFNTLEQKRLQEKLAVLVSYLKKTVDEPRIVDIGSGSGNLTRKCLTENVHVTSADVSQKMLSFIEESLPEEQKRFHATKLITEKKLPFPDNTFDAAVTYSVLHHIPDYEYAVAEMVRITKPGGIIFIDHEFNDHHWQPTETLLNYYQKTRVSPLTLVIQAIERRQIWQHCVYFFKKIFIDKRYAMEGDIHVWPDDHIEWSRIKGIFLHLSCEIFLEEDYLLYHPKISEQEYLTFCKQKVTNTKCLMVTKK